MKEPYFMTFYRDIGMLHGLYNKESLFFAYMLANANHELVVHLNSKLKSDIMEKIGSRAKIKRNAADQQLRKLKELGLIRSLGGGSYMVNPHIHGFSNNVERINTLKAKYIEVRTRYSEAGRETAMVDELTGEVLWEDE